jgi:hypothetical protein
MSHCIAVRRSVCQEGLGFDPGLKFDDIESIRRLSKGVASARGGSDFRLRPRYREQGVVRMILKYSLMALLSPRYVQLGEPHIYITSSLRVRRPRTLKEGSRSRR